MTIKEFAEIARAPVEVKSGYNGKLLCKAYNDKKHSTISEREVIAVWPEIRATSSGGYDSYARPVICVFVHGDKEAAQAGEGDNNAIQDK